MRYIPFGVAFLLMFFGVPVSISLIAGSLFYFAFITDTMPLTSVIQILVTSNMSTGLLALPFFMCIGEIMNATGITRRLMNFCDALVGHKVGGLAHVNVLLSTLNGGLTGSGAADASVQCKILVPEMVKRGYPKDFSAAITAASGMIAPVIPPGNHMIIFCTMVGCSVARMFSAGYVPGIIMCVMQMAIVSFIAHRRRYPPSREKRASLREIGKTFIDSIWAIIIALILVVGVRLGWFTITEGAIVVVLMCILVGRFHYKELTFRQLPGLLVNAFRSTSTIMAMIVGALLFGTYLSYARIPQDIAVVMTSITDSKFGFMLIAMILVFIFGMLLDGTALMMVMTPLLWPIAESYGIDPYVFGMLVILNAQVGSLTPPVGGLMYICCNLCDVRMPDFVKQALPFIVGMVGFILACMLFPQILTTVPNLMIQSFALDAAPYGIRINNILPGATRRFTPEEEKTADPAHVEKVAYLSRRIPLERYGTPEDVGNLVVFLASDKASYITGESIKIDGGLSLPGLAETAAEQDRCGWGRVEREIIWKDEE